MVSALEVPVRRRASPTDPHRVPPHDRTSRYRVTLWGREAEEEELVLSLDPHGRPRKAKRSPQPRSRHLSGTRSGRDTLFADLARAAEELEEPEELG